LLFRIFSPSFCDREKDIVVSGVCPLSKRSVRSDGAKPARWSTSVLYRRAPRASPSHTARTRISPSTARRA